jgi:hypothetical protein
MFHEKKEENYLEERLLLHKKEGHLWFCFNPQIQYFKIQTREGDILFDEPQNVPPGGQGKRRRSS